MPIASHYRQRCPRCAGAVRRVRRRSHDTRDDGGQDLRRYSCTEQDCDWQGLLPRLARRVRRSGTAEGDSPLKVWLVPLALLAVIAIGLAALSFKAL
jgi:hypothetical protein